MKLDLALLWLPLGNAGDFEGGIFERSRAWITEWGFKWFCRLIHVPRARFHRYVVHAPLFLWAVLRQRLGIYRTPFGGPK